ncbi:uncharacterized protein FA14DRAFT_174463 [Meira miltonrushii]|uniref:DUF6924 domain-containing protein n=1 Tax=Meira miltonrushii TaxID=1280837 RepID=A0A316V9B9_9BASI|nr:uncharacterized protein FA14DRAFT_174463 [Meira miltonrushii]PWN32783.1 hypothetical protein FA14DRAFT_174463 [Meira miltonrushii]
MDPPVMLYNLGLSSTDLEDLMKEIRSTSYIDEVESGEGPREESPLYNEIVPAKEVPKDTSIESLLKHAGNPSVLAIADGKKDGVLIVEVKPDGKRNELRVAPKDVIEVSCNCRIANMDLLEFKAMADKTGSNVYDSKR